MSTALQPSREQIKRADELRDLLIAEHHKVISGERRRAKAVKVAIELSSRCDKPGIEGRLKHVSTTGAIITVRDDATKLDVEVASIDIVHVEVI